MVDSLFFCACIGDTFIMNAKNILLRLAGLAVIAALGWVAFALTVHLMIMLGLTANAPDGSFGSEMAKQTAFIWMGAIAVGLVSLFVKESWGKVLYFLPLYAPPLFVIFQTITP